MGCGPRDRRRAAAPSRADGYLAAMSPTEASERCLAVGRPTRLPGERPLVARNTTGILTPGSSGAAAKVSDLAAAVADRRFVEGDLQRERIRRTPRGAAPADAVSVMGRQRGVRPGRYCCRSPNSCRPVPGRRRRMTAGAAALIRADTFIGRRRVVRPDRRRGRHPARGGPSANGSVRWRPPVQRPRTPSPDVLGHPGVCLARLRR